MRISRRTFLATTAGALVVTACGDGGGAGGTTAASGGPTSGAEGEALEDIAAVVQRFPNDALTPGSVRLPVSLADAKEVVKDGPSELRPGRGALPG